MHIGCGLDYSKRPPPPASFFCPALDAAGVPLYNARLRQHEISSPARLQSEAQTTPRLPRADVHAWRTPGAEAPTAEGPSPAHRCLIRVDPVAPAQGTTSPRAADPDGAPPWAHDAQRSAHPLEPAHRDGPAPRRGHRAQPRRAPQKPRPSPDATTAA